MKSFSAILCLALSASAAARQNDGSPADSLQSQIDARLEQLRQELIEIRRQIHRNPELSGQEVKTAALVSGYLETLGLKVRTGVGGHGVVGVLAGARPGPVIAFRADMDAVRSDAEDPVDFRSLQPGIRHICGHDVHTATGLALAAGLAAVRDQLPGTAMFLFQPAEENATGARAMLADGVFSDLEPSAIFAYHTTPYEVGRLATARNALMARRDRVRVDISGSGDVPAARRLASEVVRGVATLSLDQIFGTYDTDFVVVRPEVAGGRVVSATVTTSGPEASAQARRGIEEGLAELELDAIDFSLHYEEQWVAGVTNDPQLVDRAVTRVRTLLGEEAVLLTRSLIPAFSEDFGSFQEQVPGVMFFLGVSNASKGWVGMPHSPQYVADEEAIFVGARAMAAIFLDLMQGGQADR